MAEGLNKVFLIGNIGQPPELRYTSNETPVLSIRMATNERFKNRSGEWQDRAEWHTVVVWGKRGEGLNKVVDKGTHIFVEGKLKTRKWDDKQGVTHYTTEINAYNVILLGSKKGSGGGQGGYGPPPPGDDDYSGGSYDDGGGNSGGGGNFDDDDIPF